jgi:hypothetical protein
MLPEQVPAACQTPPSLRYSGFLFKELLCFTYEIIQVIVF